MGTLTESHCARKSLLRKNVWGITLILVLLGGLSTPALAQTSSPRFTHLTSEQGLSNDIVRCILQDSQGFMWFGTQDGLNKYDGYTSTAYRHLRSDPDSLSNNTITGNSAEFVGGGIC